MENKRMPGKEWIFRLGLFVLFLLCGLSIFVLGSPYYSIFPTNNSLLYKVSLSVVFLVSTIFLHKSERFKKYWQVSCAFFIASCANWLLGTGLFLLPGATSDTVQGMALNKISQFIAIVPCIIILTLIFQGTMDSIYLGKGKVRLGLIIGLTTFVVLTGLGVLQGIGRNVELGTIISWLPWLLIFALANGFLEELWFRGIFLKKFEVLLGVNASVLLTALIFAIAHVGATYVSPKKIIVYMAIVFALGLGLGNTIYKTRSLYAAVLFHAGADLWYIIGMGLGATQ